jgi:mannose-6-phosphate isomerase-like protein (cupin superfamily)
MKISAPQAKLEEWGGVKALNYQLADLPEPKSIVVAEVIGEHGLVKTNDRERIYTIVQGEGKFIIDGEEVLVYKGDVVVIPPHTEYNYFSHYGMLKVVLVMELWS